MQVVQAETIDRPEHTPFDDLGRGQAEGDEPGGIGGKEPPEWVILVDRQATAGRVEGREQRPPRTT
jgi:hypothetical protein